MTVYDNDDNKWIEPLMRGVMTAMQNANSHLDSIQEKTYIYLASPALSNAIHFVAHKYPIMFDRFSDILHTEGLETQYPPRSEFTGDIADAGAAIDSAIAVIDSVSRGLETFIRGASEKRLALAESAIELLLQNAKYKTIFLEMRSMWNKTGGGDEKLMSFDKWVARRFEIWGDRL